MDELGIDRLGLLTHDIGDTVGGELLARQTRGHLVGGGHRPGGHQRHLYMDLVQLSVGQQFLEALPDERLALGGAGPGRRSSTGLAGTFSPAHRVADEELDGAWELIAAEGGELLLARHARYIEERRHNESRFTPPVVDHPSPLTVVWGTDDPIAVPAMADRLAAARPEARVVRLDGVGHYPMVEAPERFLAACWTDVNARPTRGRPVRRWPGSRRGVRRTSRRVTPPTAASRPRTPRGRSGRRCRAPSSWLGQRGAGARTGRPTGLPTRPAPRRWRSTTPRPGLHLFESGGVRPAQQLTAGVPVGPVDPGQLAVGGDGPVEIGLRPGRR